ncbi:ComF family protein [Clostridium sp. DMHC 10]|uniref:ComF family protein n=1 Tax=Clostridium sp. DMHC 10 TaxID=747377 RepID=UPI001FA6CD94|nr:ComF family protein [Clostridium sp. DMHC 10]
MDCFFSVLYSRDYKCVLCGEKIFDEKLLCNSCFKNISLCKNEFYIEKKNLRIKFYSVAYYSKSIKEMIIKLKYRRDFLCGEALGSLMYDFIMKNNIKFDEITFVPMEKNDLKRRGYNQSKLLAKEISKRTNLPVKEYLAKNKKTSDQIGLNGKMRWENLSKAFTTCNTKTIANKNLILVDDVFTTGATGFFCAKI